MMDLRVDRMDSRVSDTGDGIVRVQATPALAVEAVGGFERGALPSLVQTPAALEINRGSVEINRGSKLGGMTLI